MKKSLLDLVEERTVFFDGAMGTMLMARGLESGGIPEQLNADHPERVQEIHRLYYEAGADVVHTNTFGGSPIKLAGLGAGERMADLNARGARIAREVCPEGKFVAGDIGPTGKMMAPLGDVTSEQLEEAFESQAEALLSGGADFISIETMFSLEEALSAVEGARRAGAPLVVAAVTFQKTPKGYFTVMGDTPEKSVSEFEAAGVDVIATNCTLGSGDMIELTSKLRGLTQKPILVQPNAGKPFSREGRTFYEQTPEEFARDCVEIRKAGADMIGGCCGTDDRFIREIVAAVKK